MADTRARAWSFVGYPGDSLPDNYASILSDDLHLCWAESPVHDADLNGDGCEKKAHIHFLLTFEGMKSFDQIKEITDRLNCPIPQKCRNVRALVRYFIHLDNPEKHQYCQDEIKCHGGIDIEEYFKKSSSALRATLKDVLAFCRDNNLTEYKDLLDAIIALGDDEWFDIATCRNTLAINAYLKSAHFKQQEEVE